MRTTPKICLPRGGMGNPRDSSSWFTKSSRLTPKSLAKAAALSRSGIASPDSHMATVCRATPTFSASSSWVMAVIVRRW